MAILQPDNIYKANGLTVKEYLLTKHNPNRIDMPTISISTTPLGVTIHNTEWINVSSNTTPAEQYVRATVNGNMKDVRVHFYVDDYCAWQCIPLTLSGWHAADGSGNGNRKTIAIEVIGNSSKAEQNAVKLTAYLLNKYNLTVDQNLFTHSYWMNVRDGKTGSIDYLNTTYNSKKNCPIYILPHWNIFKNNVKTSLDSLKCKKPDFITAQIYRIRKTWNDVKSQIGAYSDLDNAKKACQEAYSVFDNNGNVIYTKTSSINTSNLILNNKISVKYRVYSSNKWLGEITNYNNINENGYAGIENSSIRGLVVKVDKGNLKYRVHVNGSGWLGWISKYDVSDWNSGCAGIRSRDIDAIQIDYDEPGYEIRYRVSTINSNNYLNWINGFNTVNSMGYAGIFGKPIDKVQIEIIKK